MKSKQRIYEERKTKILSLIVKAILPIALLFFIYKEFKFSTLNNKNQLATSPGYSLGKPYNFNKEKCIKIEYAVNSKKYYTKYCNYSLILEKDYSEIYYFKIVYNKENPNECKIEFGPKENSKNI